MFSGWKQCSVVAILYVQIDLCIQRFIRVRTYYSCTQINKVLTAGKNDGALTSSIYYHFLCVWLVAECLYNTDQQLFKRLRHFCLHPSEARDTNIKSMVSNVPT